MATTTKEKRARMHSPAHPGEILRDLYLDPMGITITRAAAALDVTRKHVSAVINGRAPVTPDMALRLAEAFETDAEFWLGLQAQHDLWVEGKKPRPRVRSLAGRDKLALEKARARVDGEL